MVVRRTLHLDDEMVPRIVHRIAGHTRRNPFLTWIVPDVPFVSSHNPAFMSPDERLAIDELIDIELQRLGGTDIGRIERNVVSKVVHVGNNRAIGIGKTLRGKITDQVIVPERVGVESLSANVHTRGVST